MLPLLESSPGRRKSPPSAGKILLNCLSYLGRAWLPVTFGLTWLALLAPPVRSAPLQLVRAADGHGAEKAIGSASEMRAMLTGEQCPEASEMRWELQGDLAAHASSLAFPSEYMIVTRPALPSTPAARTRTWALIRMPRSDTRWEARDLRDGFLVFVWLVEGRPVWTQPVPVSLARGPSERYLAATALELDEPTAAGAPVVLALGETGWLEAQPEFADDAANRTLAEMFVGTAEGFSRELQQVRKIDARVRRDHATLLDFASQAGRTDCVRALLERKAKATPAALALAALNNRTASTELLVTAGARPLVAVRKASGDPVEFALSNGHLHTALELRHGNPGNDISELLALAIESGDLPTAKALVSRARGSPVRNLPHGSFSEAIATGDAELVTWMLGEGMKATAKPRDIPLLVTAAARGPIANVQALIQAGARTNDPAAEGITPLMAAASNGHVDIVQCLLQAQADPKQTDRRGRTALDYAIANRQASVVDILRSVSTPAGTKVDDERTQARRIIDHISSLRAGDDPVYATAEVDRMPRLIQESEVSASTQYRQYTQQILTTRAVPNFRSPEQGPIVYQQVSPIRTYSAETPTNHWAAVSLVVELDGTPSCIQIVDSVSNEFADAALQAIREWRYSPGERNGSAVRTRITFAITLHDE